MHNHNNKEACLSNMFYLKTYKKFKPIGKMLNISSFVYILSTGIVKYECGKIFTLTLLHWYGTIWMNNFLKLHRIVKSALYKFIFKTVLEAKQFSEAKSKIRSFKKQKFIYV